MASEQLANINVGSWFNRAHPTLGREEYERQRASTLSEVFQFLRDKPGVIYVELKPTPQTHRAIWCEPFLTQSLNSVSRPASS